MVTLYANADAIRARARTLDPVKVAVTLIGLLPFLLFWVARFIWFALSLLIAAGAEGWDTAGRQMAARRAGPDPRGG
jgi:hypothetical protein